MSAIKLSQNLDKFPALKEQFATLSLMDDLLGWMRQQKIGLDKLAIVQQDEFSLDVIVPLNNGMWAVFDST